MLWPRNALAILFAGICLIGCAGAEYQLPEITEAESFSAAQTITSAPNLSPTTKTRAENETMARKVLAKLQNVAPPICSATKQDKCWYTLELSPDGDMNAYVLKNQIVLHNGLAQYLHDEDEFAVVLAHEMGHHIAHHYDKGIQNRTTGAVIAGLIFAGISAATNSYQYNPYQQQKDMQNMMRVGASVGDISFSKEHEREADYVGAYLMARAGYDPEAGNKVWIKITKAFGDMETQLFDTHPAGPDRLAGWKRAVNEVHYSSDLMPNFPDSEHEPRLQEARVFGDTVTSVQVTTAALSPTTSSSDEKDITKDQTVEPQQTIEPQQAYLPKKSGSALVSSVSQSVQSELLTHQTDDEVCGFALEQDHLSRYKTPRWEDYAHFRKYVDEAKRRGFSAHRCAALFGWESAITKQAPGDKGMVEDRLKKLKSLYEQGLITRSSYDERRLQVLDDL